MRSFPERKAVENALFKIESEGDGTRAEFDRIFSYFFENGRRNVNAVSIECWFSPSSVYRKLDILRRTVEKELHDMKKYTEITVLWY